jgi:hypothetical protein
MKLCHASAIVGLILATAACRPPAPDPDQPAQPGPVVYTEHTVTVTEGECALADDPCARVSIRYQEAKLGGSEAVRDAVNTYTSHLVVSWLRDRVTEAARGATDAESLAEAYVAGYLEFIERSPDTAQRWTIEIAQSVVHNTPRVTTLDYTVDDDSGGAHPNSFRQLVSFDVSSGELLILDDLVADRERFTTVTEAAFRQVRGIAEDEDLTAAGFAFPDGRFTMSENFGVVEDGLLLHWDPYEVAPYSMGATDVVVSRDAILDILRTDPWQAGPSL